MNDDALLKELSVRATIVARRYELGKSDPIMLAQAKRDEDELISITEALDEHPDGYDGPCMCATCASYD